GDYLAAAARGFSEIYLGVGVLAVAGGGVRLLAGRRGSGRPSCAEGALLLVAAALSALLVAGFPAYPYGVRLSIAERFFLLPALVAAIPFALGLDALTRSRRAARIVAPALVAVIAAVHVVHVRPQLAEDQRPTGARFVRNVLGALPPHAVVVGQGDLYFFGFLYAQHALRQRPDVVYLEAGLLDLPWYRARAAVALGERLEAPWEGFAFDVGALVQRLVAEGRPVFETVPEVDVPPTLRRVGYAGMMRVVSAGAAPQSASALEAQNLAAMRAFEWDATPVRDPWSWAGFAQRGYQATWRSVASAYDAEGRPADAARNRLRAARCALGP
ncbi:MAG: hypothetical protein ACRELB_20370, partial [Polyangiaceae bacterium]